MDIFPFIKCRPTQIFGNSTVQTNTILENTLPIEPPFTTDTTLNNAILDVNTKRFGSMIQHCFNWIRTVIGIFDWNANTIMNWKKPSNGRPLLPLPCRPTTHESTSFARPSSRNTTHWLRTCCVYTLHGLYKIPTSTFIDYHFANVTPKRITIEKVQ